MQKENIVKAVWELAEPVVLSRGLELVDVEFRRERQGWVLRIYIDRPGGVTLGDCVRVSEILSDLLDARDFIHHPYNLEVSSPGLDRPLRKPEDFERFAGDKVKITIKEPLEGRRNFTGLLRGLRENKVLLEIEGRVWELPLEDIKKAHIKYEFDR
jgi:ribosome maturation factor RimP